ncbi:MAG: prolipoprotein diacylglyceryl transferase [Patescibacteria group bacterium]
MFFQTFTPSPIFLQLGPVALHWYGLLVALGVLVGYFVAYKLWQRSGREVKRFEQLVLWIVLAGFVGARLVDVFLFEWDYFKDNLILIPQIWQGGLAIHGGLLGGFLVLWWYAKKRKDSLWQMLDIFTPAVVLGQAVGRWGNYFNQELFGAPTTLPWGIYIEPVYRPAVYIASEFFHPVFLYESLVLFAIFFLLRWLAKDKIKSGTIFLVYLSAASLVRLTLEFIRVDEQLLIWRLRSGLLLSLTLLFVSLVLLTKLYFKKKPSPIH